jgi:hypothetical protein
MRTCSDCGETKQLDERYFLRIKGQGGFYGRCRLCRNRRNRERYWSDPEITEAERASALRNWKKRECWAARLPR